MSDITLIGSEPNISISLDSSNTEYFQVPINNCDNQLFYKSYIPSVYQEYFPKGDFNNDGTEDLLCVTVEDSAAIAPWFLSFDNQNQTTIINSTDIDEVKCNYELPYNHFPVSTDDANHIIVLKTTIRTADLNGDGYADIICTNKVVHSNTHVEATSHSFLNQYGTTTIKMAYGGILLTERYDHHFIEFNGQRGADLLTIFLGKDIKYKVYSDGVYIGPDEVEPNRYGNIPFQNIQDRCFADKVVTGDFNGDGRQDFMCLTGSAIGGTFEKDHTLVGISDEGEAPVKPEKIMNNANSDNQTYIVNIVLKNFQSPTVISKTNRFDTFIKQSSYVFNNVTEPQNFAPDILPSSLGGGKTSFGLKVQVNEQYATKMAFSQSITKGRDQIDELVGSTTFGVKVGYGFDWKVKVKNTIGPFGPGVEGEVTNKFSTEYSQSGTVANKKAVTIKESNTDSEINEINEIKSYNVEGSMNVILAPGECAYAQYSFLRYDAEDVPFFGEAYIDVINTTSGTPVEVLDIETAREIALRIVNTNKIGVNDLGELYFNVTGIIKTAVFSEAFGLIQTCDFIAILNQVNNSNINAQNDQGPTAVPPNASGASSSLKAQDYKLLGEVEQYHHDNV